MRLSNAHRQTPSGRPRARGLGVPFPGMPGEINAITDVGGVEVGYCTLIEGEGPLVVGKGPVRTGVTAIFPRGRAKGTAPVYAGFFNMGGNGEMSGAAFIEERGRFEGPVVITNTHSCGLARDVTAQWMTEQVAIDAKADQPFWLPVAAETFDGMLNDINGHHVTAEHVRAAFADARGGPIDEGNVGGGTGMTTYQFKGGSGTASRVVEVEGSRYTVGAFVQSNFGKRHLMTVAGIPIGVNFPTDEPPNSDLGSIIGVVATDAPLLPHQLKRLARRSTLGIARSGGIASNESGDLFVAFSTANEAVIESNFGSVKVEMLGEGNLSVFYEAAIQAMDEAIMNALFAGETMVGRDGNTAPGLPIDEVRDILRRHGRLSNVE
ncbi:MAG: P1 family peptidase [Gammaproteobacteria bacterium]|nr:P1 family peptidase [Gammaproteobacteria bacterium]